MPTLFQERCFNHALREAAARCPECGRCFCRECVTAHDGRMVCAACLSRLARLRRGRTTALGAVLRIIQGGAGLATAWVLFYLVGRLLVALPDSFHEGTFWQGDAAGTSAGTMESTPQAPPPQAGKKD